MDHHNNANNANMNGKVGSRVISPSLKVDAAKRLGTMAESTEAPLSAAEGILAGLNKQGSLLAVIRTRNGSEEVLATISPLMAVVALAKQTIRRRQGLVVTPAMQADLREILAWHAKRCAAALVGSVYKPVFDPKKTKKQQQTIPGMEVKERRLIAKMQPSHIHRSPSSSTVCSGASTASPSTRSSTSSGSWKSRTSSKMCSFPKESRGVVYFPRVARVSPGAAFVPAVRPSARVDPRVSNLSGSGAIRR